MARPFPASATGNVRNHHGLLARYDWWRFEPHPDWVQPCGGRDNYKAPFAARIPGEVRIIYLYWPTISWDPDPIRIRDIEPDTTYQAFFWDPRTGEEHPLGIIEVDDEQSWNVPVQPTLSDWVVVLEAQR